MGLKEPILEARQWSSWKQPSETMEYVVAHNSVISTRCPEFCELSALICMRLVLAWA